MSEFAATVRTALALPGDAPDLSALVGTYQGSPAIFALQAPADFRGMPYAVVTTRETADRDETLWERAQVEVRLWTDRGQQHLDGLCAAAQRKLDRQILPDSPSLSSLRLWFEGRFDRSRPRGTNDRTREAVLLFDARAWRAAAA